MPTATITISLPESLKSFIESQVSSQGFGTVSEYVRSLVRDEQKRTAQKRLESLLLEGLHSEASEMTENDWTDIREEIRRRHRVHESGAG